VTRAAARRVRWERAANGAIAIVGGCRARVWREAAGWSYDVRSVAPPGIWSAHRCKRTEALARRAALRVARGLAGRT